jgi:hypothetical protein
MKLDTLSMDSYTSFLLKGPWGFGKTIAAASFAKSGPVWLSYWDKKGPIELVQFFKRFAPELLKNIEYEVYGAHNANEYLNHMFRLAKDCRYAAVINDSVTSMTAGAVNWSLGFRDNKKNKDKDKIMPDFDEYKVETSIVTQALDICRTLPCHVIWTCHPLPSLKVEGSGAGMKVSKVNSIVTYGSKVAGIVPGQFSEIYHFSKSSNWDSGAGKSQTRYIVSTEQIGDDYAKSNIGLNVEMDITDRLFYDVWKEEVKKLEVKLSQIKEAPKPSNPFEVNTTPTANSDKKPWEK